MSIKITATIAHADANNISISLLLEVYYRIAAISIAITMNENTGIEEPIIYFCYYGLAQDLFPTSTECFHCNDDASDWRCASGLLPTTLFISTVENSGH